MHVVAVVRPECHLVPILPGPNLLVLANRTCAYSIQFSNSYFRRLCHSFLLCSCSRYLCHLRSYFYRLPSCRTFSLLLPFGLLDLVLAPSCSRAFFRLLRSTSFSTVPTFRSCYRILQIALLRRSPSLLGRPVET